PRSSRPSSYTSARTTRSTARSSASTAPSACRPSSGSVGGALVEAGTAHVLWLQQAPSDDPADRIQHDDCARARQLVPCRRLANGSEPRNLGRFRSELPSVAVCSEGFDERDAAGGHAD